LLMKPKLLVLDECTNALDSENLQKIQTALTVLHGTMTILIISHQHEMSAFADKIIHLKTWREDGTCKNKQHDVLDIDQAAIV